MARSYQTTQRHYGRQGLDELGQRFRGVLPAERRFFLYLTLVQVLLIASLVLALSSPKALDTLTAEKTVRGTIVEAPIDRAGGLLLFAGAALSGVAVIIARQRFRYWDRFWLGYSLVLLLCGLEESDWLGEVGLHPRVLGYRIEAFHDLLTKVVQPLRAGTSDYPFAAPVVLLAAIAMAVGLVMLLWRWAPLGSRLDLGLIILVGLGVLLGSLGMLIDADLLAKPVAVDWKAHLEEPLEAVGAVCLALVGLEGAIRAMSVRT